MYNFALAFFICALVFVIGEVVTNLTKAWVPSVFVTAAIMLVGYWTILPKDIISDSMLIPFGSTIGIYLLIAHMGTVISIKQLMEQWKVIVVCLSGLFGMCAIALLVCPMLMDKNFVIAGLPPLTGGIVSATIMQDAASAAGLEAAAIFAITMYCIQGFAGYPLTAVCLQLEGKRMLKDFRTGVANYSTTTNNVDSINGKLLTHEQPKKKLLPPVPDKWNTAVLMLGKLGLVSWFATMLATIDLPIVGKISGAIWALLLGVLLTNIGFLDENILNKANSFGVIMFALMMYVFNGLKDCTLDMLIEIIGPMIILIVVGVTGMAILCFITSKILKMPFLLAFATALTALYGFPPNAIITESTCNALAQNEEEKEYLMGKMFPAMIVGGFTTVTITSVFIAGFFSQMF